MRRVLVVLALVGLLSACAVVEAIAGGRVIYDGALYVPAIDLLAGYDGVPLDAGIGTWPLDNLGGGVALLEGTGWFEHAGAMRGRLVLAGHTPGGFARVRELAPGDVLYVIDPEVHRCVVTDWLLTDETDTRWLMPTDTTTVTLLTCEGAARRVVNARCD